jgi:hypothetical protein
VTTTPDPKFLEMLEQRRRDGAAKKGPPPQEHLSKAAVKFAEGFALIAAWLAERKL